MRWQCCPHPQRSPGRVWVEGRQFGAEARKGLQFGTRERNFGQPPRVRTPSLRAQVCRRWWVPCISAEVIIPVSALGCGPPKRWAVLVARRQWNIASFISRCYCEKSGHGASFGSVPPSRSTAPPEQHCSWHTINFGNNTSAMLFSRGSALRYTWRPKLPKFLEFLCLSFSSNL